MKQFYRILLAFTCFLLFLTNSLKADHMVGYDMTMVSLGNDLYKFRVVAYRDVTGIPIQSSFNFNIYKNPHKFKTLYYEKIIKINVNPANDCRCIWNC